MGVGPRYPDPYRPIAAQRKTLAVPETGVGLGGWATAKTLRGALASDDPRTAADEVTGGHQVRELRPKASDGRPTLRPTATWLRRRPATASASCEAQLPDSKWVAAGRGGDEAVCPDQEFVATGLSSGSSSAPPGRPSSLERTSGHEVWSRERFVKHLDGRSNAVSVRPVTESDCTATPDAGHKMFIEALVDPLQGGL